MSFDLEGSFGKIREQVPSSVTLIAVSKTHPVEKIELLYKLGQRDFGENYVQELVEKAAWMRARGYLDVRWHYIGHLQTNKVKALVPHAYAIHAVDSNRLAQEISKRSSGKTIRCFVEVNIDEETSKAGVFPGQTKKLCAEVAKLPGVDLRGLMCIPDPTRDSRDGFRRLKALERECRPHTHGELSMGMSNDFQTAIEEGSTSVRIGTLIFGERHPSK